MDYNNEPTYVEGIKELGKGAFMILQLLPKTFVRQTTKLILNHPLWVLFFLAVIGYQLYIIAEERVERDIRNKQMIELQEKLDSVDLKQTKYCSFSRKELSELR